MQLFYFPSIQDFLVPSSLKCTGPQEQFNSSYALRPLSILQSVLLMRGNQSLQSSRLL